MRLVTKTKLANNNYTSLRNKCNMEALNVKKGIHPTHNIFNSSLILGKINSYNFE